MVGAGGVAKDTIANRCTVDMRHIGQGHEITVPLPDRGLPKEAFLKQLLENFYKLYRELSGRTVAGPRSRSSPGACGPAAGRTRSPGRIDPEVANALKGPRPVYFEERGAFVGTPVYDHYRCRWTTHSGSGGRRAAEVDRRSRAERHGPRDAKATSSSTSSKGQNHVAGTPDYNDPINLQVMWNR